MPVAAKTLAASLAAGLFRIFLMPVDALKTIMQARGGGGAGRRGVGGAAGPPARSGRGWRERGPPYGLAGASPGLIAAVGVTRATWRPPLPRPCAGGGRDRPVQPGQQDRQGRAPGAVPRRAGRVRGDLRGPLPLVRHGGGGGGGAGGGVGWGWGWGWGGGAAGSGGRGGGGQRGKGRVLRPRRLQRAPGRRAGALALARPPARSRGQARASHLLHTNTRKPRSHSPNQTKPNQTPPRPPQYNTLDYYLPRPTADSSLGSKLLRSAFMGFWCAGGKG
jgi:hypothetical protein